jgi:hypothetical protein
MNLQEFIEKNWYYLKTKIDWDWDARYWDWIPSVTTLLWLIWDEWFDYVKNHHADKLDISAKNWTAVHNEAENFFKKNSWVINVNKNILKFHSIYVDEIISTEKKYFKWWIQWTVDLVAEINYHKYNWIYCNDYKFAKVKSEKYKLQLWLYEYLTWYPWLIIYAKNKLEVVWVENFYMDIWLELKDYFFKLLKQK